MGKRANDREGTTDLGLRIKNLRLQAGWSQTKLGKKAGGVTKGAVSQWEKGDIKNMELHRLFKMADAFKREPRWLAIGEGPEFPPPLPKKDDEEVLEIARWLKTLAPAQFKLLREMFTGGVADDKVPTDWNARPKRSDH